MNEKSRLVDMFFGIGESKGGKWVRERCKDRI